MTRLFWFTSMAYWNMRNQTANRKILRTDETTKEQPPVTTEVEVIDQVDDQAIVEMTGQTIQSYVYSIKQGRHVVEGLTLAGINEAANRRGEIQVYVKQKFNVENRNDMTQLAAELKAAKTTSEFLINLSTG